MKIMVESDVMSPWQLKTSWRQLSQNIEKKSIRPQEIQRGSRGFSFGLIQSWSGRVKRGGLSHAGRGGWPRVAKRISVTLWRIRLNSLWHHCSALCRNVTVTLSRIITNFLPTESLRSCAASQKERHPPIGIQHWKLYSPLLVWLYSFELSLCRCLKKVKNSYPRLVKRSVF